MLQELITVKLTNKQIAERVTIQSFLNCYLRETGNGKRLEVSNNFDLEIELLERIDSQELIYFNLERQGIKIFAGLRYWSLTGRHLFDFPLYYKSFERGNLIELDYVTLVTLLTKELTLNNGKGGNQDELLLRVIQSCQNIELFVKQRRLEIDSLYSFTRSFIETEQSLVFGHHLHPTPKSRQGFNSEELPIYSPESNGKFSLHYFRAHSSIVLEGSNLSQTAIALIKTELIADPTVSENFKNSYCQEDEYALVPVHPWQANWLKSKSEVKELLTIGLLEDLGQQGSKYLPTSSIRTVYHPERNFMFKLSLNVKITNSVRGNLYKELERGVEISQVLDSPIGEDLGRNFPDFKIVTDPAYITIPLGGKKESGFATILRSNPFASNSNATCLIALCQDAIAGGGSRLAKIITNLAKDEKRSLKAVSLDWFTRYLKISLEPIVWLYFSYGIAVEAHQQNSVIELENGYPVRFFYRDNQGYYYRRSYYKVLDSIIPGISQKSETICDDAVIDERLTYYLFINNLFGLINAFGVAGLIDEHLLLLEVSKTLDNLEKNLESNQSLLIPNLRRSQLKTKANLLTRFHDMDELVGSVATQSVYVEIDNPLYVAKTALIGGVNV
ncbi:MAG: IucA/IucC family siderophore biosynthesis protein [Prochloraceae cyanobacterium]|nr:IucA/IucC family siderophore biosynthesis protein [Prochloraceae cyanobacterium]